MLISNGVISTLNHIRQVQEYLHEIAFELIQRGYVHDASKLREPELTAFDQASKLLGQYEYGSKKYDDGKKQLGEALQHHYQHNRHHPEHYDHGVNNMTLIDVVEMFCDWRAAVKRQKNGDLIKSIEINEKRFNLSLQLAAILKNTASESEYE